MEEMKITKEMRTDLRRGGVAIFCKCKGYWAAYRINEGPGRRWYDFGRVYHCGTYAHYEQQGCKTFANVQDCIDEMCKFFGIVITSIAS
jgi:hypothetical protein